MNKAIIIIGCFGLAGVLLIVWIIKSSKNLPTGKSKDILGFNKKR